jgi:hypothetical protein
MAKRSTLTSDRDHFLMELERMAELLNKLLKWSHKHDTRSGPSLWCQRRFNSDPPSRGIAEVKLTHAGGWRGGARGGLPLPLHIML